jgi:hypothetical protein
MCSLLAPDELHIHLAATLSKQFPRVCLDNPTLAFSSPPSSTPPSMSPRTIIEGLQNGSAAELEFISQLREGMCTLLNGMEAECYRRGDALDELKQSLLAGGLLQQPTESLQTELESVKAEKAALQDENRVLRRRFEKAQAAQQNVCACLHTLDLHPD